jgi:AraC-like DNA-binding protein
VKVPHNREIANHGVAESCVLYREVQGEALTGVRIGQPLSRDSLLILGAHAVDTAEGNMTERVIASALSTRRGLRPWHVRTLFTRETGDLHSDRQRYFRLTARIGKARSRSR